MSEIEERPCPFCGGTDFCSWDAAGTGSSIRRSEVNELLWRRAAPSILHELRVSCADVHSRRCADSWMEEA